MHAWQIVSIPISLIDVDPLDPDERTFKEEFCRELALSIESDGLLHPLLVRHLGDGRYRLIAGRHRLHAVHICLRWTEVPCKVAEDVDDEMARAMTLAENLFVLELSGFQLDRAMRGWWELYHRRNPGAEGRGSHMRWQRRELVRVADPLQSSTSAQEELRCEEAGESDRGEDAPSSDAPASEGIRSGQKPVPFYRAIQSGLGVSSPTAQRLSRVARKLTIEQIDVLEKLGVTQSVTHKLAGLGDEKAIQSAIDLIASGRDPKEVVRLASKKAEEQAKLREATPSNGGKGSEARAILKPPKPSEQTDEEWLSHHCDVTLRNLKRTGPYKRDAILYRRVADVLPRFRGSVKKALAEAKHADGNGSFFGAVTRIVKAAHPSHWLVCGACNGTGSVLGPDADGKEAKLKCGRCYGAAYIVKMED